MLHLVLQKIRPNSEWILNNDNYENLVWLDKEQTKPTKKEVDDGFLKLKEEQRIENINSYTQTFIYLKYPQPKQSSANLGVYDEAYKNEMVTFIKKVVDLSNKAIDDGTSIEDYKIILESE